MKKLAMSLLLALGLAFGVTACSTEPNCPAGQVAEFDDDGWECEPDANQNGVDDEEEQDD